MGTAKLTVGANGEFAFGDLDGETIARVASPLLDERHVGMTAAAVDFEKGLSSASEIGIEAEVWVRDFEFRWSLAGRDGCG